MLFNSYVFIGAFLPVTLVVYRLLCLTGHPRLPFLWLVVASLFFYGWWNPIHVPLLMASIVANYLLGMRLTTPGISATAKRSLLIFGITANLAVLAYFKYSMFIVDNVGALTGLDFGIQAVVLPLGISFFTFQKVAYLVDAAEGKAAEYRFLDYCLFVTFFPQLIAGPIVHHREMMPQFRQPEAMRFSHADFAMGLTFFVAGLWKKVVLADTLATMATPVFAVAGEQALTAGEAWTGAIAYSLAALLRLLRLFRHGDRACPAVRHPAAVQLRLALQVGQYHRLLAALAHDAVAVPARLSLRAAGRQPEGQGAALRQPVPDDADRWAVARCRLDLRDLGSAAWRLPDRQPRLAGIPQGRGMERW